MKNLASLFRRKIVAALLTGASCLLAQSAFSHGYMVNSRADLCHTGKNSNCGPIQWEPQSVEGGDRYPETGPSDGTLASAGNTGFSQLNEQSRGRWSKVAMKSGAQTLQWQFTAPHSSRDIRYWITKVDWDPNAPLTRAQFEAQPFCQVQYGNAKPVASTAERANHYCNVPQRTGYHIILSVWDVADTVNSFILCSMLILTAVCRRHLIRSVLFCLNRFTGWCYCQYQSIYSGWRIGVTKYIDQN